MAPLPSEAILPSQLPADSSKSLEVIRVSKAFGFVDALYAVSFSVPAGQIVGLLGPNGAGKSTTMKAVLGLVRPDSGEIRLFGKNVRENPVETKRQIGYVPESPALYEFLTGAEYLDFVADMYGLDRSTRRDRLQQFLTGFELTGHEPRSARVTKDLLRNLAAHEGVAVLFSTHVLEIAQAICDRVVILHRGRVLASDTVAALRDRTGLAGRDLEEVFLSLTGTGDLGDVVDALSR